jgi:predicted dehydrogenase
MGHRMQMEDFCSAILEKREPQLGGSEGRRAVELICGIYESARTGKPYKFSR